MPIKPGPRCPEPSWSRCALTLVHDVLETAPSAVFVKERFEFAREIQLRLPDRLLKHLFPEDMKFHVNKGVILLRVRFIFHDKAFRDEGFGPTILDR